MEGRVVDRAPLIERKNKNMNMKKFGFAAAISSGLVAAVLGLAAPASAVAPGDGTRVVEMIQDTKVGIDHLNWLEDIRPKVNVPMVDTSVRQGR
jgi:hypothetical protein